MLQKYSKSGYGIPLCKKGEDVKITPPGCAGRIANILLFLAKHIFESSVFRLPLTRKEIAQFAGCSTENVINTLRKFGEEGIIRINGKEIGILDEEALLWICRMG